ncbi:6-hydroxy-d-nicotine oxidase [Trichoderma arundinaceum]|uniref:6-hydroxy-d-nicotine oxidase n=1 Tax=Trichoderma arundinaceum TaxID=490622 RepID=A0A395NPZ8_TRIAR|nr:6-hydroxy-d-nicotine oxidase [Trichoderma arundinaceum]
MAISPQADSLFEAGLKPDQVFTASDAGFNARQSSYWSRSAQSLQPACIVQPRSAQEVAAAVRALVAARIPFAVRSGGHMAWAGSNNIGADGVTIDLEHLNWIQPVIDEKEGSTVDIGPGNRWGKVYAQLEERQLTVAGGREGNVGVAGLLLGGGMAFFTARHGLACDNVVEYEVVLGDGRIVRVRGDGDHADLFRALKGGGSNFGIVTNFRMRALQSSPVWAGMTVHPKEATPQAITALKEFTDNVPADVDSNLLCFFTYTGEWPAISSNYCIVPLTWCLQPDFKDIVVLGALIQIAGVEEAPAYKKWLEMPTTATTCKMTTVPQLAMDYSQAKNYFNTWFTATFKNDVRVVAKAAELHEKLVEELKSFIPDGDFITQCLFQPFPRLFGQHSAAAGGNIMGVERQPDNGLLWLAVAQVRTQEQERFAYNLVRNWVQDVKQFAATIDGNLPWAYLNYADKSQDPLASYGLDNVRKIKEVVAKYDPEQVFQTLSPGGFKISNVSLPN